MHVAFLSVFLLLMVSCVQQHEEKTSYRVQSQVIEQLTVEFATPCSPTGSHYNFVQGEQAGQSVITQWPSQLLDPANSEYGVPGNRLVLSGQWYEKLINDEVLLRFFRVSGWEVIPPYSTWNSDSTVNEGQQDPVSFNMSDDQVTSIETVIDSGC